MTYGFDDLKAAAQAVVDECQRRIKDGDNSIPWLDMTVLKQVLAECHSAGGEIPNTCTHPVLTSSPTTANRCTTCGAAVPFPQSREGT